MNDQNEGQVRQGPPPPPPRPVKDGNTPGLVGFILSLLGLVSCGLLAPIGLIVSLFGLGKEPKGFAIAGVVLGAVGSCGGILSWILFLPVMLGVLAAIGMGGVFFAMAGGQIEAQIEMDMIDQAIVAYEEERGALPLSLDDIAPDLPSSEFLTDHWGNRYVYTINEDGQTYTLQSKGPDGQLGTADDIDFTRNGMTFSVPTDTETDEPATGNAEPTGEPETPEQP